MSSEYLKRTKGFVTSTKLRCFMSCPLHYKQEYIDEAGLEDEAPHFILGRAFEDSLRLTSEEFDHKYRGLLTPANKETVMRGKLEAKRNPQFDPFGEYENGKTFYADYTAHNGVKFKLRAEIDRYSKLLKLLRDYKFVRDISKFQWDAQDVYDYPFQMGFYQIVEAVANDHPDEFYEVRFDVADKSKNAVSASFLVHEEQMAQSRAAVIQALEKLAEAQEKNQFPGKEEDLRLTVCAKCPLYRICPQAIQRYPESF